jgi:hypothetical protein
MRCEDIRKQLGTVAELSRLPDRVRAHLLECRDCRRAQALYSAIERELKEQPSWQPPPGFAGRVGSQGLASLGEVPAKPPLTFWSTVGPAVAASLPPLLLGLLAAIFSMLVLLNLDVLAMGFRQPVTAFAGALLVHAIPSAWITAALSLGSAAYFTRRALRSQ